MDPRADALADQLDLDPDDVEARRAYGDWLEEHGDPRSQYLAMQLLRERITDPSKLAHLDARLDAYFEEHRDHFLGPLAKVVPKASASSKTRDAAVQRFGWKAGFIHSAKLSSQRSHKPPVDQILGWLLGHPSGRFLVELVVDYPEDCAAFVHQLISRVPRSLRSLVIGANEGDLDGLWAKVPHLHRFILVNGGGLGELDLPALREARFLHMRHRNALESVVKAKLPHLETLEIEFFEDTLDDLLVAILERDDLPQVHTLAIGTGRINALLPHFVKLPLVRQIKTLDLTHSWLFDDEGAASLEGLTLDELRLHPRANGLSPQGRARLARVARSIIDVEPPHYP